MSNDAMDMDRDEIGEFIHQIRISSHSDFAALALPHHEARRYHWHYTSGNRDQRYKQMVVRRGKGLAGTALLLGKTLTIDDRNHLIDKLGVDSPLMLAEGLQAATIIPIPEATGERGILMVGVRQSYRYSESELSHLQDCAGELAHMLETS